ncbi:Mitochondrial GTPase [Tulasnella sp. 427]|nr:Mitochondrial GTPase [Tulasnella sp. 427]
MSHLLPSAASWFPGHMATFTKQLPALLAQTHVVLEVRDVRLPLTSINPTLEAALQKWRKGREASGGGVCERIVVYSKRDLISGGEEALRDALSRHFDHRTHFNSNGSPKDIHDLQSTLVSIAKENAEVAPALNVLVVGMPNMGKSTLLNSLRWAGTNNATKAMRTSALPGLTQKTSERLKLCLDPPIYAVDSPGVMVPFLGRGNEGRERAFKLALIAGLKDSLYDDEALSAYLLYKLNRLNPSHPAYLSLYPPSVPQTPTDSVEELLDILSHRLNARLKGGEPDIKRTAKWFLKWWREGGATKAPMSHGWGFDFNFRVRKPQSLEEFDPEASVEYVVDENGHEVLQEGSLEEKMEREINRYVTEVLATGENTKGFGTSVTKERQIERAEKRRVREERRQRKRSDSRR